MMPQFLVSFSLFTKSSCLRESYRSYVSKQTCVESPRPAEIQDHFSLRPWCLCCQVVLLPRISRFCSWGKTLSDADVYHELENQLSK